MLANKNKQIINKLAKNTVRTNKKKFGIMFFTVILSAFMLVCVFTTGITYLDLSRLQDTRLNGAEYDVVIMNGFTKEQKETLINRSEIQSVGVQSYAGYIKSTEFDDTVETGLLWCDETFWEEQMSPARTKMEGSYPQKKNELMVTKEALKACGNEDLEVGDSFLITYENNTGVHTEEFTISGIWDGYGDKSVIFVSKEFYYETGYNLEYDGILCIKLKQNFIIPGTIEKIEQSFALSGRQVFAPTSYIENSLKILLGICGLCLVICLSAYLLIYNILYLSVLGKIRYYGLLQTLGMTKKQLVQFLKSQMLFIGMIGIVVGISFGVFSSLVLVPHVMKVFGITSGNLEMHFYPAVLIISAVTTGIAILCGIRKPILIATNVTPVEATKYQVNRSTKGRHKKSKKVDFFWKMVLEQLDKDKKKAVVVFLSLATSLSVFYCLTTIIYSQGERTVVPAYWDDDFIIRNATQTSDDIDSIQPALDDTVLSDLSNISGIKEIHVVEGLPVTFSDDEFSNTWLQNYTETRPYLSYSETLSEFRQNPEKYYGMIKGIDESEFDYLNQLLSTPIDKQDFTNGEICIVAYPGFEVPSEYVQGENITFYCGNQAYELSVAAVSYEGYYGGTRNIGPNLIVSQEYLEILTDEPYILNINIKYDATYDEDTENAIRALLKDSPYSNDLLHESRLEDMKTIQASQGDMMEIGTVISLLLLLVGVINYANTMTSSIQNRRLTFSIMESVGMSRKQMINLLCREGLLYAVGSIFITLTVGTGITYIVFQSMNYMKISFAVPVFPLLCAVVLVTILCIITPVITYKKIIGNRSIVERLREYE